MEDTDLQFFLFLSTESSRVRLRFRVPSSFNIGVSRFGLSAAWLVLGSVTLAAGECLFVGCLSCKTTGRDQDIT